MCRLLLPACKAVYFAICGSFIQAVQSCVFSADVAAPAFLSFDSTFSSAGNFMDPANIESDQCRSNPDAPIFQEMDVTNACFSDTGTGTCSGSCMEGFAESTRCLANDSNATFSLSQPPSDWTGAVANDDSCPASPPTPAPTLFPPTFAPNIPATTEQPLPTSTAGPSSEGGSNIFNPPTAPTAEPVVAPSNDSTTNPNATAISESTDDPIVINATAEESTTSIPEPSSPTSSDLAGPTSAPNTTSSNTTSPTDGTSTTIPSNSSSPSPPPAQVTVSNATPASAEPTSSSRVKTSCLLKTTLFLLAAMPLLCWG